MSVMLDLVSGMCALSGVSGMEHEVRDFIRERVMAFSDQMREDAMGNLLIFKLGRRSGGRPRMVCAHMDEVGLIVRRVCDDGSLRILPVGGVAPGVVLGRRVLVGPQKIPGVVCTTAKHLLTDEQKETMPKISEMFVDIGAESRDEALTMVGPGDICVFTGVARMLNDRLLSTKAIDDRVGCAMVMRLIMEEEPVEDTWFVFSAQEELGGRGAMAAAGFVDPSQTVVLEATTAADLPTLPSHKQVCRLGGGVVIPAADLGTVYDETLRQEMISLAERKGILWQNKELLAGGTDAGSVHTRLGGIPCVALAVPVRYLHSPHCVADVADFDPTYALLRAYVTGE